MNSEREHLHGSIVPVGQDETIEDLGYMFFRVRWHTRKEQPLVKGQEVKDTDSYISVQG